MANSTSHAALPYPIKNARFSLPLTFRVAAGTPTDPTTPDTEFSTDGGATFTDCAEEITTGGTVGIGYLTLTGAETNANVVCVAAKSANCLTTPAVIYPRVLASVGTGTLSAGSAGGGTLGTLLAYDVTGCFIQTTGGTGGGGTGGADNQARKIVTYNTGTGAFTVTPDWAVTPSTDTTYSVLLPEGVTLGMLKTLNPTTAGRTLDVSAGGEAGVDWANVGSPTTTVGLSGTTIKTATDLETDTQDIQSRLPAALTAGGNIKADALAFSGDTTAADNAESFFDGTGYAGTNNVIPLVTTTTNLTNAPTNGDLTATMKTSVTTACTASTPTAAAVTGAVGSVTGNVGGNVTGSVGSLGAQAKTDVNAEVVDALATDTYAEPAQGAPAATTSLAAKLNWLYKSLRNKKTQTASQYSLFADDNTTIDTKATVSDDGTTTTVGKLASGP